MPLERLGRGGAHTPAGSRYCPIRGRPVRLVTAIGLTEVAFDAGCWNSANGPLFYSSEQLETPAHRRLLAPSRRMWQPAEPATAVQSDRLARGKSYPRLLGSADRPRDRDSEE